LQIFLIFCVCGLTVLLSFSTVYWSLILTKTPGVAGGSFVRVVDHQSLGMTLGESIENTLRFGNIGFDEVIRVRRMLEVPAARLAAKHRGEDELESMRGFVGRQKDTTVDDPEVPSLDMNLHMTIAEASGNRVLASFVNALHRVIRPVLYVDISPEVGRDTVGQHLAIVRAIANLEPEEAASAMEEHLDYLDRLRSVREAADSDGRRPA
ncbi:MAG: FCD domain-containing protein, partial [Rubrobacter sp.]|nr:FCD domain-containing protein [Rubrobacter sp.]